MDDNIPQLFSLQAFFLIISGILIRLHMMFLRHASRFICIIEWSF